MALTAEIDGAAVVLKKGSLRVEKRVEERSTASFTIVDLAGTGSFSRGMPVSVYDDAIQIFGGFISNPGCVRIGPKDVGLYHEVSCMDNHYLADKRLVVKSYASKTLKEIVEDIWTDYLQAEGVTIGEVQTGPTIESAVFNYVRASEAYDALKELSGFTWFIDESKDLYFVSRSTYNAPWDLDGVTYRPIKGSPYLSGANPFYRNKQYVRGGTGETSLQTETRTGDGETQSFALGYPLSREPTITEDGIPMTVGIKGIDAGKDYYWNKGDENIWAEVTPGIGVVIEVEYYGQYPLMALAFNDADRAARQAIEGGTGLVEDIVLEADHESSSSIRDSAKGKLARYCQEAEKFVYQTVDSGLSPGQLQRVTYSPFGFNSHEMLIESVTISSPHGYTFYEISAITGPAMGSWARFFSGLLLRQDRSIRLGDAKLIVLLVQSELLGLVEVCQLTARAANTPEGTIAIWAGTLASIPVDFNLCNGTGVTPNLIARFLRGAASGVEPGGTGGSDTHTHTMPAGGSHSHTLNTQSHSHIVNASGTHAHGTLTSAAGANVQMRSSAGSHQHTTSSSDHTHSTDTVTHTHTISTDDGRPPFYEVAPVQAGTGGAAVAVGLIIIWSGTIAAIPVGWDLCDGGGSRPDLRSRFIRGVNTAATNPGTTGGAATHTHTEANSGTHTHTSVDGGTHTHTHSAYTWTHSHNAGAGAGVVGRLQTDTGGGNHTHSSTDSIGSHNHNPMGAGGNHNHVVDAAPSLPPCKDVAFIYNTSESRIPKGGVLIWAGLLADIPAQYMLCDGVDSRPDYREYFIRGAAPGVDPGGTDGSLTHTHTDQASGAHTDHTQTVAGAHQHAATDTVGSHTHAYTEPATYGITGGSGTGNNDPVASGDHSHTYNNENDHTHASISDPGTHTHTTNTASSLPGYYDVAFIIKV